MRYHVLNFDSCELIDYIPRKVIVKPETFVIRLPDSRIITFTRRSNGKLIQRGKRFDEGLECFELLPEHKLTP